MPLRFSYDYVRNEFRRGSEEWQNKIAFAATAAVKQAGDQAQQEGRQNIGGAGNFPAPWVTGWRADMLAPKGSAAPTIDAAVLVHHRIGLASVFETGAKIAGQPLLWLPIEKNLPPGKWTPKKYIKLVGLLRSVNLPGRSPMLVSVRPKRDAASIRRLQRLGRTTPDGGVPVFVGIDAVTLRKRFNLVAITKKAAARVSEFYFKNLKA